MLAVSGVLAPGCIIVSDDDSSLTVDNQSDFVIEEINVTEVDNPDWGPNIIPGALLQGESVTISLNCDTFDARLIDEDDVECFIYGIDLCFDDALWVIRNNTCSVWNAAKVARDAAKLANDAAARENARLTPQTQPTPQN